MVEFVRLIDDSKSRREFFEKLGLKPTGRTLTIFYERVVRDNVDISHFGRRARRNNKISLEEIMVNGFVYQSNDLRKRLIKDGILENKCSECALYPEWNGKPLTMRLDHRNGDRNDNRKENLRLLCPNCDSQSETFGGRNRVKYTGDYFNSRMQVSHTCDTGAEPVSPTNL